jgi:hypothetical protein
MSPAKAYKVASEYFFVNMALEPLELHAPVSKPGTFTLTIVKNLI